MKEVEVIGLLAISAVGVLLTIHVALKQRRAISFSTLALATYVLIFPVSGIAGLLRTDARSRGYFDLEDVNYSGVGVRLFVCTLGLVALAIPLIRRSTPIGATIAPVTESGSSSRRLLFLSGLVLLPLCLSSLRQMLEYARTTNLERITTLTDGMARVGFTAQWITWSVSFICLALILGRSARANQLLVVSLLVTSTLIIATSMAWTGGRAIIIMMGAPLLFASWRYLTKTSQRVILVAATIGVLLAFVDTTASRTSQYSSAGFELGRVIDWEVGRYSMSGWAIDFTTRHGLSWGETILQGVLQVPTGFLRFFGLNVQNNLTAITNLTGMDLLGSPRLQYVVPGMTAELYVNFGLIGVAAGYWLLGVAVAWVDRRAWTAARASHALALSYLGILLLFCSFSAQSGALFNYAIFTGFPVFLVALLDRSRTGSNSEIIGPIASFGATSPSSEQRVRFE